MTRHERFLAALPAVPAHETTAIPAPAALDDAGTPVAAIGIGRFMVAEIAPPQSMSVTRCDGYRGERPAVRGSSRLAAGRAGTRALLAESGAADPVFTLDHSGFLRLQDVETVETHVAPVPASFLVLKVNAASPTPARGRR